MARDTTLAMDAQAHTNLEASLADHEGAENAFGTMIFIESMTGRMVDQALATPSCPNCANSRSKRLRECRRDGHASHA
ncbi:hypothetical protein NGM99_18445 [Mesorhizobium sp. RP14(2022)]|uniref:Transposase n=1 Tax=Mesorhizobium liriopis TaxID=2953882 RepID=A0ABT1CAB5_9HYPH|nr:hypothetical protein [Mesorhizobium liriopis]MCO6051769.1 hypothetical protein [Mesorhizobium liriopis]